MKIFKGKVIHTKMGKTATVLLERVVVHPVYKKRIKKSKKYHVHDEIGVKAGDVVKFAASKPYSKLKKWKVIEVVESKKDTKKKTKTTDKKRKAVKKIT